MPHRPFTTTGFHKSGTVWFEHLVFALPGVCGPLGQRGEVPKAHLSVFLTDETLAEVCQSAGIPASHAAARLITPRHVAAPFGPNDLPAVRRAMDACLRRMTPWAPFDTRPGSGMPDADLMTSVLCGETNPEHGGAAGTPSKHVPVERLRREADGFRVLQIIRDPRDVIVSHVHHDLRGLAPRVFDLYARETAPGTIAWRPDWRERVAERRVGEMQRYFGPDANGTARYEDLLEDPERELGRVAAWLGADDPAGVRAAVAKFDRDALRTSDAIRRPNHVRRARSGEWRRQLDRRFIEALGPGFIALVERLGYEPDDSWVDQVPEAAPEPLDSASFVPELCVCNRFRDRWARSDELRARFPDPNAPGGGFYGWLRESGERDVLAFDEAAHGLAGQRLACA